MYIVLQVLLLVSVAFRDINRNRKPVLFLWQPVFDFILLSVSSRKYIKMTKCNSHICLTLNVYNIFHQTVRRNHILQDLIGLET